MLALVLLGLLVLVAGLNYNYGVSLVGATLSVVGLALMYLSGRGSVARPVMKAVPTGAPAKRYKLIDSPMDAWDEERMLTPPEMAGPISDLVAAHLPGRGHTHGHSYFGAYGFDALRNVPGLSQALLPNWQQLGYIDQMLPGPIGQLVGRHLP